MKNLLVHQWSVCFGTEECLLMACGSQKKTEIKHINLNLAAAFQLSASRRDSRCFCVGHKCVAVLGRKVQE